jgi:integrase
MRGKQAKILSDDNLEDLLLFAETSRHPLRNKVIVLLSAKAGLRAGEIAHLTWAMVTDPTGDIGTVLELPDRAAKKRSGRVIPLHEDLRRALAAWRAVTQSAGPVIVSERGGPMTPQSIVVWFANAYRVIGLDGCSSHSGRRRSSPEQRGLHIKLVVLCATCSCWLAIGRSRQRSGTLRAILMLSASSCR